MQLIRSRAGRRFAALLLLIGLIVAAGYATASGKSLRKASNIVTLTVWDENTVGNLNPIYNNLVKLFEQHYPNVHVHRITTPFTQILQQQKLALSGSNPPDIVQSNQGYGTLGPEVAAHLVIPLTKYEKQYNWQKCQPQTILQGNEMSSDGKQFGSGQLYGWSDVVGGPVALYYNKAKLKALGVSLPIATFADFEKVLAKAKAAGQVPIELGELDQWPVIHDFQMLVETFVPNKADLLRYIYGTGPATFDTPWALQAANTLYDWAKTGYFEKGFNGISYADAATNFTKGASTFLVSGPWLNGQLYGAMGKNVGVMLMPTLHAGRAATGDEQRQQRLRDRGEVEASRHRSRVSELHRLHHRGC